MQLKLQPVQEPKQKKSNPFLELRLKYLIDGVPCSQRKLSDLMNKKIPHSHISALENGKKPSMNELECYHDFFGVPYEYLLNKNQNPSVKHDSFYKMVQWLSNSKKDDEINMWNCFIDLTTSESGLVLLYYITEYTTSGTMDANTFAQALGIWKNLANKEYLSYQEIRQIIDNGITKK